MNFLKCRNSFIKILIIFQSIFATIPLLLNKIIEIGGNQFRYVHFSFYSNGDMIVDTHSYPKTNERRFFGLKKNGRFFFEDENGQPTGYYSLIVDHDKGRFEGESYCIKLTSSNSNYHGRELIFGISKNSGGDSEYYTEIYNLNNKNYTKYFTKTLFGYLVSDIFTIIESPDESDPSYFFYTFIYIIKIDNYFKLLVKKIYFSFELNEGHYEKEKIIEKVTTGKSLSSFYIDNFIFIFIYLSQERHLIIWAYSSEFVELQKYEIDESTIYGDSIFFKGIHLQGNKGLFIYYKNSIPILLILEYNLDKTFTVLKNVNLNKSGLTFNVNYMLNDLVKLNDYQICFVSISDPKEHLQFVLITLYKNSVLLNIRYYQIEISSTYNMKIYLTLKASLYNQFLALAFSHCTSDITCTSVYLDAHKTSLIIFNYPNSEGNSLDVIFELYSTNKNIEKYFSFNFEGKLTIENNLFGFVYKGTKIMKCPNGIYLTNTTNENVISEGDILLKNENVSLVF